MVLFNDTTTTEIYTLSLHDALPIFLLILVAVTLLVLGLTNGSSALLISSIVASLLAAVALVVGARQAAASRAELVDDAEAMDPDVLAEADERARRDAAGDEYPSDDFP